MIIKGYAHSTTLVATLKLHLASNEIFRDYLDEPAPNLVAKMKFKLNGGVTHDDSRMKDVECLGATARDIFSNDVDIAIECEEPPTMDTQVHESKVILATLQVILAQCCAMREIGTTSCIENWKQQVHSTPRQQQHNVQKLCEIILFQAIYSLLHLLAIAILSIPAFTYMIAQSVGSYGVFQLFSNSTLVSIWGVLLKSYLYRTATMLAGFRKRWDPDAHGMSDGSTGIRFNQWRTKSMFIIL